MTDTAPKKRGPKPKPEHQRKRPARGGRAPGADQSDEAKTERYVNSTAVGEHHHQAISAKARANRLRELIEPKTEAMVQVMIDIAEDKSVHPSIRMECADRVLSRAYGKPKETMAIEDAEPGAQTDEVMGLLNNIFEAVGLKPMLEAPKPDEVPSS